MKEQPPIHVLFLCLGNICRSPLAQGIFEARSEQDAAPRRYVADSAGTSAYHVGESPDRGSVRVARSHGIDISRQRSRQLTDDDMRTFDFIVPMDTSNRANVLRTGLIDESRVPLIRQFDPQPGDGDVPDPWGGGSDGFELVYTILDRSMPGLFTYLEELGPRRT